MLEKPNWRSRDGIIFFMKYFPFLILGTFLAIASQIGPGLLSGYLGWSINWAVWGGAAISGWGFFRGNTWAVPLANKLPFGMLPSQFISQSLFTLLFIGLNVVAYHLAAWAVR